MSGCQQLIDELWDFADPAASEERFRAARAQVERAGDRFAAIELLTQVGRALGLQRRFEEAHATLDAAERELFAPRAEAPPASDHNCTNLELCRVRIALEHGRVLNSSGRAAEALPFLDAGWRGASAAGLDAFAIDAAHMIAIVHGAQHRADQAMEWNLKALAGAKASDQPRARQWRGSLHNNIGWTLHEQRRFDAALGHFEQALACRIEQGTPSEVRIARWCVARCLRSLGRTEEALALQGELQRECEASGAESDSYVAEELGECLLALGREAEARFHFRRAHEILSKDPWLAEREPERIQRLDRLAQA